MTESSKEMAMTADALKKALVVVRDRIAQAEKARVRLEQDLAVARQEEHLLTQLLELRGVQSGEPKPDHRQTLKTSTAGGTIKAGPDHPIVEAVFSELAGAGRPSHISDLMRMLRSRGIPIPGSGNQANLISYLRRDTRFVRTSRGMYGLAAWGLENSPKPRREKRKRVRFTNDNIRGVK